MGDAVDISLESLILYHGSNLEVINPKILKGRFTKDFEATSALRTSEAPPAKTGFSRYKHCT